VHYALMSSVLEGITFPQEILRQFLMMKYYFSKK
jgi:hypothetical protein